MQMLYFKGDKESILDRISLSEAIVSDFDGTDVKTPLVDLVKHYALSLDNLMRKPSLLKWGIKGVIKKTMKGKDADSLLWKEFSEIMGDDIDSAITSLYSSKLTEESSKLEKAIFPGVKEFYDQLPDAERFYTSRNFPMIISLYSEITGVPSDNIYSGYDKSHLLENIIQDNPSMRRYVIRGDSHSDDDVLDVAQFYKERGAIDDYVGIAIGNSSHNHCPYVEVLSPNDQSELAREVGDYQSAEKDLSNSSDKTA